MLSYFHYLGKNPKEALECGQKQGQAHLFAHTVSQGPPDTLPSVASGISSRPRGACVMPWEPTHDGFLINFSETVIVAIWKTQPQLSEHRCLGHRPGPPSTDPLRRNGLTRLCSGGSHERSDFCIQAPCCDHTWALGVFVLKDYRAHVCRGPCLPQTACAAPLQAALRVGAQHCALVLRERLAADFGLPVKGGKWEPTHVSPGCG